jgi:hypothetical protein
MALVCLVYASRATDLFSPSQLSELIRSSAERNAFRDISGALLYCDGFFVQMLEGEEWVVRDCYEKIAGDPRHRDVLELVCLPITKRSFGGWAMSLLHQESTDPADVRRIRKVVSRIDQASIAQKMGLPAQQMLAELKAAIEKQSAAADIRDAA